MLKYMAPLYVEPVTCASAKRDRSLMELPATEQTRRPRCPGSDRMNGIDVALLCGACAGRTARLTPLPHRRRGGRGGRAAARAVDWPGHPSSFHRRKVRKYPTVRIPLFTRFLCQMTPQSLYKTKKKQKRKKNKKKIRGLLARNRTLRRREPNASRWHSMKCDGSPPPQKKKDIIRIDQSRAEGRRFQ